MRIGIVGCGHIAETHARILADLHGGDSLVFCDRNKEKADAFAARYAPGPTFERPADLLADNDLDAVHVLTRVQSHAELADAALRAGAHVYLEKPVTETAADYAALAATAEANERVLCAGLSALGMPVVRRAIELIESGRYGRVLTTHCDYNSSPATGIPYGDPDHWSYALPGGILQNIADHPAGLVVATMDGIDEHRTLVRRRTPLPHDSPDLLHVAVANDHQMGSFTISFGHGNAQTQLTCCLEEAMLLLDLRRQLLSVTTGRGPESRLRRLRSGLKLSWSFGGGTVVNVAKAASGSLPSDPGLAGTITNFYATIEGTERLLADQRTTTGVISLLEGVWTDVASVRTP